MTRVPEKFACLSILALALIIICFSAFWGPKCQAAPPKQAELFPVYDVIKPNVKFWTNIFTKYTRGQAVVHDTVNLSIIYEQIKLNPAKSKEAAIANKAIKKQTLKKYRTVLLALSKGKVPQTPIEKRVAALFPGKPKPVEFKLAAKRLRVQTGIKGHFMGGVIRSGALINEFKTIFRSYGLPEDLAYLPCLESAYDIQAYSKFGAAGLWQFTHSTGKLFMDINYVVDQRRDPIVSTHGAARLLKKNYKKLKTWPMAITAYNHGLNGMCRAKNKHKTYPAIYKNYRGRSFKFASRNFYPEFIAARQAAKNYVKYYGNITLDKPEQQTRYKVKGFVAARDLVCKLPIDLKTLKMMNPALRNPVFNGRKYIPPGQTLYLPKHISSSLLDKTLGPIYYTAQRPTPFHRVVKGDTAGSIAESYKVPLKDLVTLNGLGKKAVIHIGQTLKIPFKEEVQPSRLAAVSKPDTPARPITRAYSTKQPPKPLICLDQSTPADLPPDLEVVTSNLELKPIHGEKGRKYAIIRATPEETINNYADWLGVVAGEIVSLNKMSPKQRIKAGNEVTIALPASGAADFEEKRFEFHQEIIEDFFDAYFIAGTQTYKVAHEETVWDICRKELDTPFWLLKKFNPDIRINTPLPKGRIMIYPLIELRAKHPDGSNS